jgi:predicted dehydrogenase
VESITVTTETHISAVLEFESGVIGTLLASYDVWDHHLPRLEVYGTQGAVLMPDPNTYDGDVLLKRRTDADWRILPPATPAFAEPGTAAQFLRGPGVADLVAALDGEPQRANAEMASHIVDAMEAIDASSGSRRTVKLSTRTPRPLPITATKGSRT